MAAIAAGVGLMMVCCSSSVAAAMMMGGDDDDDKKIKTPLGPSPGPTGPSAPTTTTFLESEIPNDAMVIDVGEFTIGERFNSPKDSTDDESTYFFVFQSDGNLVWYKQDGVAAWNLGSQVTVAPRVYLQGDGNICAYGTTNMCTSTHDSAVPSGQHKLVGTKEGLLYVDHGTGVAGRAVLVDPSSTTETYVLPY